MIINQDNQTLLSPPLSQKNQEMNNITDLKMQQLANGDQTNINFIQDQGEDADNVLSLLYNEIFQNPMDVTTNNALINQAILANKANGATNLAASSLLEPKIENIQNNVASTSTTAGVLNSVKSSMPSPMNQTPFLHPMFSTPTFSYLNESAVSSNGVSSPLFEFTPPSTPPHTHSNGSSKLKNMYKPTADAAVVENSPLLCSDYFMVQNGVNKQITTTALENEANLASTAFSPALNLPMKKLALFSPNVEDTAVTDVYPSSYNYLDDPIVNSPLLPIQDEQATTSNLLPLYNTGMYDVQSPFLMEKPDEGLEADASMLYNQISPSIASTTSLLDTSKASELLKTEATTSLKQVSPFLMNSPYLTEQGNAALNQSPFLQEQAALNQSPFLQEQAAVNSIASIKNSPFLNEQASLSAVNSPYISEQPIITLNDSPCLPEQSATVPLRNKTTSPLLIDPRYAALNKGMMNHANPAYLLNKKRKLGMMNYPYGPLSKIPRIPGAERSALDEISSGFIKKSDNNAAIKPSPLLQESSIDIEPMETVSRPTVPLDNSLFLRAGVGTKMTTVKSTDSLNPALISPNTTPSPSSMATPLPITSSAIKSTSNPAVSTTTTTTTTTATTKPPPALKPIKIEKSKAPVLPAETSPTTQLLKEYSNMMLTNPAVMLTTKIHMPSLVSMAGIKLDTKAARATDDDDKGSKSKSKTTKTTKSTTKRGKRAKKAATPESAEIKASVNPGGEFMKIKLEKTESGSAMDTSGYLVPPNTTALPTGSVNPGEEMDYHDIPTIKLGNTPNLDMLSPASSSLGMSTPNGLASPLLKTPISYNLNSNIQLVKKRAKKKYPCTYPGCTKSFSRPCHRQSHERSHENSRPFVCPECKRAFCRKHDMIRHQRIHSKERPYQCKICKRKFARGDALVRHRTRPTSSCYQADMAYAKKLRQQQHRLLQQQQQLEYERLQKEKQMEEAAAAAAAAAAASGATSSTATNPEGIPTTGASSIVPTITVTSSASTSLASAK